MKYSAALVVIAGLTSPSLHAQQVFTAVESEYDGNGPAETIVGGTAGQKVSTSFGGANTYAISDFGVNKIYASGNADYEQYASSAWVDTYTVGGTAGSTVHVSFTFSIDGLANFDSSSGADFNFNVYALRGGNWSMSGYDGTGGNWNSQFAGGTTYERLVLSQTTAGLISQLDMRDFGGLWNYNNNAGQPGAFSSHVTYVAAGDYFSVQGAAAGQNDETRFYATGFQNYVNGVPVFPTIVPYNTNAQTQPLAAIRANLDANYSLLDSAQLCSGNGDGCASGSYPGSDISVSFDLLAGSTFSLASFLYADDLRDGTIDFFNTAKVTGVSVSPGASLTSQSGTLNLQSDGSYGYAAALGAVPEPATWALMVIGFGLIGAATRRRGRLVLATAQG